MMAFQNGYLDVVLKLLQHGATVVLENTRQAAKQESELHVSKPLQPDIGSGQGNVVPHTDSVKM